MSHASTWAWVWEAISQSRTDLLAHISGFPGSKWGCLIGARDIQEHLAIPRPSQQIQGILEDWDSWPCHACPNHELNTQIVTWQHLLRLTMRALAFFCSVLEVSPCPQSTERAGLFELGLSLACPNSTRQSNKKRAQSWHQQPITRQKVKYGN